jgi:uracil-DNA glycosylase
MTCAGAESSPEAIAAAARACTVCAAHLPLGPRPAFQMSPTARLLIIGQAPGTRVHETGIPWNDPSGDRLRGWLDMSREPFYCRDHVALVGMGLCYPGRLPNGGDAPPRPECAPLWHRRLFGTMPEIRLTLLVGSYALTHFLGKGAMTARVRDYHAWRPRFFPLPHPSWRTTAWERRNPWFQAEVVPALRVAVAAALADDPPPPSAGPPSPVGPRPVASSRVPMSSTSRPTPTPPGRPRSVAPDRLSPALTRSGILDRSSSNPADRPPETVGTRTAPSAPRRGVTLAGMRKSSDIPGKR